MKSTKRRHYAFGYPPRKKTQLWADPLAFDMPQLMDHIAFFDEDRNRQSPIAELPASTRRLLVQANSQRRRSHKRKGPLERARGQTIYGS